MIFVTVGTTHLRFDRLFQAIEGLPAADLVVQHGPVAPPSGVAHAVPFMSYPEMLDHFARADVVVTHAGVGSILCAIGAGQTPVVAPRLKRFAETVDDHQAELAKVLGDEGTVIPLWDMAGLAEAVAAAPARRGPAERAERPIHDALRAVLRSGR